MTKCGAAQQRLPLSPHPRVFAWSRARRGGVRAVAEATPFERTDCGCKGLTCVRPCAKPCCVPPACSMWTQKDSTTWMQYVSKEPASRLDVLALQEALDERLQQRQARLKGICPVREDLFRQCFGTTARKLSPPRSRCPLGAPTMPPTGNHQCTRQLFPSRY
ncbi:hypothetical protein EON68_00410 [archaeon]|nr:MAG: hypothetical protein EON68_00410 [archaeon]